MEEVKRDGPYAPPPKLRGSHYSGAKEMGHGVGYEYPHTHGGFVEQEHLPEILQGRVYYEPTDHGEEKLIRERLIGLWGERYFPADASAEAERASGEGDKRGEGDA